MTLDLAYDEFDRTRPAPVIVHDVFLDQSLTDWAEHFGLSRMITTREGATFVDIGDRVFIIPVFGAQFLHEDRHIEHGDQGTSPYTWNLVVSGSETQGLLLEVEQNIFEHHDLRAGLCVFFDTGNRHAITRRDPRDTVVILQACGFGPDQMQEALSVMKRACQRAEIGKSTS